MAVTLERLARCLGRPVWAVVAEEPFSDWDFEKSSDPDLPRSDYVFPDSGFDIVADEADLVTTLFLYFDDERNFAEGLAEFSGSTTRSEVLRRLGAPLRSRKPLKDPILGDFGAADRFDLEGHSVQVEFRPDRDQVKLVVLMRSDVLPSGPT